VPIIAAVLFLAVTPFVLGSSNTYAEYACQTYGAGVYDAGNAGTGEDCPTDTTTPATTPGTTTGSNSSSNGSTGTSTIPPSDTPVEGSKSITLDDYTAYLDGSGQPVDMKMGDKVYFTVGSDSHTITLKTISSTEIVVTIASTPVDVTVPFGKAVSYDVNKDGVNDITIAYKSLSSSGDTSTVVFSKYLAATTTAPATTNPASASTSNYWLLLIVAIVIVIAIIALIVHSRLAQKTPNA
jgi:hypothetical protein